MKIRIDPLDKMFSEYVRKRAVIRCGGCEYCGKRMDWKSLQCSHFHGRRKGSVRYDSDNACGLCFSCHIFLGANPYKHTEFFKKRLGAEKFEQLNIRAEMVFKVNKELIKAHLKELLQGFKEERK
jgi:hypothetical protein